MPEPVADRQAYEFTHRENDERRGRRRAYPHTTSKVSQFLARFVRGDHRFQCHTAERATAGFVAYDLGMHGTGPLRARLDSLLCFFCIAGRVEIRIRIKLGLASAGAEVPGLPAVVA